MSKFKAGSGHTAVFQLFSALGNHSKGTSRKAHNQIMCRKRRRMNVIAKASRKRNRI